MSLARIEKLTPEQEALIPVYREKWRAIALSTQPIDHQKATVAVKAAYATIGLVGPKMSFFDSPYTAFKADIFSQLADNLRSQLELQLKSQLKSQLESQLETQLWSQLASQLELPLRCN